MSPETPCIVGIGHTRFYKWGTVTDRSEFSLACEAVLNAMRDAGVNSSQIDGFVSYSEDRNEPAMLHKALGCHQVRRAAMVWGGGGGGSCGPLAIASDAIRDGRANVVVAYRALCQGQQFRFGQFHAWTPETSHAAPFGLLSPPQMAALLAQRYLYETGAEPEAFGEITLACRDNATRNPNAVMKEPLTMEDYLASRMIASPLRLLDCCLESDGAAAIVITSLERARDLDVQPIAILAADQSIEQGWGTGLLAGHNMPIESYTGSNGRFMTDELFARADVSRADIDVAQIYDAFTATTLIALEDYGFCKPGEGADFVRSGAIRFPDGELPINTSGGNLSEAYIHGFGLVLEGVRQLRGTSTSQVDDAEVCFVSGGQAVSPASAAILGRV